jgi:hypothetical protein
MYFITDFNIAEQEQPEKEILETTFSQYFTNS